MATALLEDREQRLVLSLVSWQSYEQILDALEGRHLRITYDSGQLEIMTKSHLHEFFGELLGHLVLVLATEIRQPIHPGGSTTFKREILEKGLEPDKCFWLQNARTMLGKLTFDSDVDPPPDLAIEIDITRSSMNRMKIYAVLRVPEVWRFDGETLTVYHLIGKKYKEKEHSAAFPALDMNRLVDFLLQGKEKDVGEIIRTFLHWVREELQIGKKPASKKNGR